MELGNPTQSITKLRILSMRPYPNPVPARPETGPRTQEGITCVAIRVEVLGEYV